MSIEQSLDLAWRAEKFAALGDPVRLAIVEQLTLGDELPSDLALRLGIGSNLLAHHLNVLEGVGIVRRLRSEGDRRRTYVSLAPSGVPAMDGRTVAAPERVLFVCTANTARSQLAASLWVAHSEVPVASAGTHPAAKVHTGARAVARRHGLHLSPEAQPRSYGATRSRGDLVVTVCDRAREELGATGAIHWSVPDPVPIGTKAAFEAAFDDLDQRVSGLAHRLTAAS